VNGSVIDLYLLVLFGTAGYLFRRLELPVPPLILALVLGGMMAPSFRQAMTISGANPRIFVGSTVTLVLAAMIAVAVVAPFVLARMRAMRRMPQVADEEAA
jgi:putative tricarboxylic transport membrane protein